VLDDVAERARPTTGNLWDVQFRKDGSLLFFGDSADAELATLLEPAAAPAE
jgi:hypothetical protein